MERAFDVGDTVRPHDHRRSQARHLGRRAAAPITVAAGAFGLAVVARQTAPWIPWEYLLALITIGMAPWLLMRSRSIPRPARVGGSALAGLVLVALLPVPWMTVASDEPVGTAWRLDGRLAVDGRAMDPPGEWYWLTVGRPPLMAEVAHSWLTGAEHPTDLRRGNETARPRSSEPFAAAVGLRAAGLDVVADEIHAIVGGPLAGTMAGRWFRGLSVGRSHGLMVALVTYAGVSGDDLARGRAIAGTGVIADDGSVLRVGGLRSKATAAIRAGADVLVFPAEQADQLDGLETGSMRLVPVTSLAEAVAALRA